MSSERNAPRGRPAFADTQCDQLLALLRKAGPAGVSKEDLIFKHRWTQAAARIFELEQQGYTIRHDTRLGERFVVYVLESEPLEVKPLPSDEDWYTAKTGKPRPTETTPADLPGPLFDSAVRP